MECTALGESLMTKIALSFVLCYICHSTLTSAVCTQTGDDALSNTYSNVKKQAIVDLAMKFKSFSDKQD